MLHSVPMRFILLILLIAGFSAQGQTIAEPPVLPDIIAATDKGVNVISWTCQYDGIKSIAVQRSQDSVFNYKTVGYVKITRKGRQAFIDGHPDAGDNWYRLYIAFNSDLTWYSNNIKIHIDSNILLEKGVIPPNDSLQQYASNVKITREDIIASSQETTAIANASIAADRPSINNRSIEANKAPKLNLNIPKAEQGNQMSYIKSRYVFTNPFTGHVTLELPKDSRKVYSIQFFKQNDPRTPVLDVPRLRESDVVIDKRNFQGKGVYKFILKQSGENIEEGYISIY